MVVWLVVDAGSVSAVWKNRRSCDASHVFWLLAEK